VRSVLRLRVQFFCQPTRCPPGPQTEQGTPLRKSKKVLKTYPCQWEAYRLMRLMNWAAQTQWCTPFPKASLYHFPPWLIGRVAQVVEYLPSKPEAQNPSPKKNKNQKPELAWPRWPRKDIRSLTWASLLGLLARAYRQCEMQDTPQIRKPRKTTPLDSGTSRNKSILFLFLRNHRETA
jgi:hypothetical protein